MYKIAWHPIYVHPVPDNHRFPMEKYELLPQQLKLQGLAEDNDFFEPSFGAIYDYSIHDQSYLNRLNNYYLTKKEERASGFKQSPRLIEREYVITNGTIEGAQKAIECGAGFNIAGGTHHAFSNAPEGFCLLNDQAIASMYLLREKLAKSILIIDLDVHQGNGTAEIVKNQEAVFTLSFHGKNNYPHRKQTSDLDIAFDDNTTDEEYLDQLKKVLRNIFIKQQPDFVFYQAGVDILRTDKLGRLSISLEGCKQRDQLVFETVKQSNIPIFTTIVTSPFLRLV